MYKIFMKGRLVRVSCMLIMLFGACMVHANDVTLSDAYYQSIDKQVFQNNDNRILNPAQPVRAARVQAGGATSGATYSASALQTGSSAVMQSYGATGTQAVGLGSVSVSATEKAGEGYAVASVSVIPRKGQVYSSADEAYAAATGDRVIMRGPTGGAASGSDKPNTPSNMPISDAPWWLLLLFGALYMAWKRVSNKRTISAETSVK